MYRGAVSQLDNAAEVYADDVKDVIDFNTNGNIALFMAEPIQGVGGLVPMPEGYVKMAADHAQNAGGLYLSDEVQTGFGRCGSHFWGFEMLGTQPDIVTMAK